MINILLFLFFFFFADICGDGDITLHSPLSSQSNNYEIVRICIDGVWWFADGETWTEINTRIVCRTLGYTGDGGKYANFVFLVELQYYFHDNNNNNNNDNRHIRLHC